MAKTLLLADDSVTIQKVVGISLASEDIRLVTVDNGDDAVKRARELRPDAILADCVMPGRSGYEVSEAIQADAALRHIPVLLLTGTFEAFDEERAARCGAAGHIAKPFEAQTLLDEVHRLFALAASRKPAPAAPPRPAPAPRAEAPGARTAPAPTAARPAAAPAAPARRADSFDFFDEEIDDLLPAELADEPDFATGDEVDLDSSETPFAFGGGEAVREAPPQRRPAPASAERTLAMLPPEPPPPAGDDLAGIDATIGEADLTRLDTTGPLPSFGPERARAADPLEDLELEVPGAGDDPLLRVDDRDLAGATVLDPHGASGFDVSASDLGDPFALDAIEPPRAAMREPRPLEPPRAAAREPGPLEPPRAARESSRPAPRAPLAPAPPPAAPAAPAFDGSLELLEPEPEPPPQPEFPEDRVLVVSEPEPELEPKSGPRPAPEPDAEVAALAESAVDAVGSRLRVQLHDTLEKAAWESLSDVTDQIVRQAVERIEAIAWEVIPQMAETLIREEIRRMKGEDASQP
jgi:CheY-like chemotaxis protein